MARAAEAVLAHRTRIVYWCVAAVITVFVGRLYALQVVSGERYRGVSASNSVKLRPIPAPRGLIWDRDGTLLVGNRSSRDLVLDRERLTDAEAAADWVSRVTGRTPESVQELLRARVREPKFKPLVVAEDLAFSQVAFYEARKEDVPALSLETHALRQYPNDSLAAHALGYVGEISESELSKPEYVAKKQGDLVGKSGVEKQYDRLLAGAAGRRRVIVDNVGRLVEQSLAQPPVQGADVHLTLDHDVQLAAERGLAGMRGAAVMLDVRDGSVLALVSAPTFEPNAFVNGISSVRWKQYSDDPGDPLRFRAVAGTYPPGSCWKPLMSAAALETKTHSPSFTVTCNGTIMLWGRVRHCWKEEGHGTRDMHGAFVNSCNVYYWTAGRDMTQKPILALGEAMGFGQKSAIDLPGEVPGTLPSDAWKRAHFNDRWYPGDTINLSIGQGFLIVTPLQVAVFAAAIANGGDIWRPHVFSHATDSVTGEVVERFTPVRQRDSRLDERTVKFLHQAMEDTVKFGTGSRASVPGVRVAGKTGTAQASALGDKKLKQLDRPENQRDHAWFMGFAPVGAPEIAFAVVIEHAGLHGGTVAAPIARDMLEAYFHQPPQVASQ